MVRDGIEGGERKMKVIRTKNKEKIKFEEMLSNKGDWTPAPFWNSHDWDWMYIEEEHYNSHIVYHCWDDDGKELIGLFRNKKVKEKPICFHKSCGTCGYTITITKEDTT